MKAKVGLTLLRQGKVRKHPLGDIMKGIVVKVGKNFYT